MHDEILAVMAQNLEYAIRRVQLIQVGLKLYGTVHIGFWLMLMSSCGVFAFKLVMQMYWKEASY